MLTVWILIRSGAWIGRHWNLSDDEFAYSYAADIWTDE